MPSKDPAFGCGKVRGAKPFAGFEKTMFDKFLVNKSQGGLILQRPVIEALDGHEFQSERSPLNFGRVRQGVTGRESVMSVFSIF
jgi:hypothetical protein